MALQGNLEDLALLDILQVVAFSRKTGSLHVESALGRGGVIFKNGLVYYATSPSTVDFLCQLEAPAGTEERQVLLLEQIQMALRELISLREGNFAFELSEALPARLDGIDMDSLYLEEGVDTQRLLLNLAKEMDEDRRETTEAFASAFDIDAAVESLSAQTPKDAELTKDTPTRERQSRPVVLVDDEETVTRVVAEELISHGYDVVTASGPSEGASTVRSLAAAGERPLLVTDLRMPTTTGRSFLGGFELVRTLRRAGLHVPVLLMTEKWTPKVRERAKKLGIRHATFKPALSKLDAKQYGADLRSFASSLRQQLEQISSTDASSVHQSGPTGNGRGSDEVLAFLTAMTERLRSPAHKGDISRMVLEVASRYLERGILFLVKRNVACGLGGFGLSDTNKASFELARKLSVDISRVEPMAEVVHGHRTRRLKDPGPFEASLYGSIGRRRAQECLLMPILNHRDVLAILYGDNALSGKPLGTLGGLELFMAQAGMALENLSLQRKLSLFQSKLVAEEEPTKRGGSA